MDALISKSHVLLMRRPTLDDVEVDLAPIWTLGLVSLKTSSTWMVGLEGASDLDIRSLAR
jgi:hypothetical protein